MTRLRAAVLGLGVGEQHIHGYRSHPECDVVAVCDFADDKLAMARERYPELRATREANEILDDPGIDVVSVATYDNFHRDQIVRAIERGKHVFVEKPVCLSVAEAEDVRAALKAHPGVRLSSNLILRRSPRFLELREQIQAGEYGRLYYLEGDYNYGRLHKITEGWRGRLDFYSVVYGGAIHIVDLLLWLSGERVTEVTAFGNAIASGGKFRFADLVASLLRFESGLVAKVTANFGCVYPHFHSLAVYGTRATFVNGLDRALRYDTRDPEQPPRAITTPYPGVAKGDLLYSFIEGIRRGTDPLVTEEDVFRTMSVCFAIEQATHERCAVPVRYL
ncbi:MAG TPA: Gfo/Idh/MocA family oxidoreductase [Gemmatimonadales bacterium]|nr:Gfo/Idh/MocA family oxidoreductase [Gemmatimonadales bacterium]